MKRLFYLTVVIGTVFLLSSCEKENTESVQPSSQVTTSNTKSAGGLAYYRKFQVYTETLINEDGEEVIHDKGYCVMIEHDCFPWDIVIEPAMRAAVKEVFDTIISGDKEKIKAAFTKHKEILVKIVDEEYVNKVISGDISVIHFDGKDDKIDYMVFVDLSGKVIFAYPMIL